MKKTCILFCNCGADVIPPGKKQQIRTMLSNLEADVFQLNDFCGIALNRKDFVRDIDQKYSRKIMVACYPRAIKSLLAQNDLELNGLEVLNFRKLTSDEIEEKLKGEFDFAEGTSTESVVESGLDVPAWYPVIDQPLCIDCGKCFKFCLFGVYTFDNKQLKVVNPLACKNNCPACGRNCPTSAIIFPRLKGNSVLSGEEPRSGANPSRNLTVDSSLIETLNQRSALRRNILRSGLMEQAEEERRKALEELSSPKSPPKEET